MQITESIADRNEFASEVIGTEFCSVELERKCDLAHDLGFLVDFAFPEEADKVTLLKSVDRAYLG